jgi:hypothetical protein
MLHPDQSLSDLALAGRRPAGSSASSTSTAAVAGIARCERPAPSVTSIRRRSTTSAAGAGEGSASRPRTSCPGGRLHPLASGAPARRELEADVMGHAELESHLLAPASSREVPDAHHRRLWVLLAACVTGAFLLLGVSASRSIGRAADPGAGRHRRRPPPLHPRRHP